MTRVLVIDDVAGVRRSIRAVLTRAGYEVYEAENGLEGLKAAGSIDPDVVLVDMLMPEQDGLETLEKLRSAGLGRGHVAMSGGGSLVGAEDALANAEGLSNAVLRKPFENAHLVDLVANLAGERPA